MRLPRFEYLQPRTLEEACSMLAEHPGQARVMAGGTDVLVELKKRGAGTPRYIVGLRSIPGLDGVGFDPQVGLRVGAMATFAKVARAAVAGLWGATCATPRRRRMQFLLCWLCGPRPAS